MKQLAVPFAKNLVLVGGGHAHALLLRRWGMAPLPGARLTLINPAPTAPYTGMLPGFVAGHYNRDALEIDLVKLARFAGARLIFGMVEALDPERMTLSVAGRPAIPFDIASIDIGITSDMPEVPGFKEHAVAAKPLGPFASRWSDFLGNGAGDVLVVGGGVAGVELALAMNFALAGRGKVNVVEATTALSGIGAGTAGKLLDEMRRADITLIEGVTVSKITAEAVVLSDGRTINAGLTVGAAGARPFPWLETTNLALENGFISVDETLRSASHPHIYAVGDCAYLSHAPRPKAGVFAVRAAPVLTANIQADLTGGARLRFKPQKNYLKLISLGRRSALADKYDHSVGGEWAWTWKDRIDRAFMTKLNELPAMPPPALPARAVKGVKQALGPKPLCGGCGAKVGSGILERALSNLPRVERSDVESVPGDDAAVLRFGKERQVISTDHLRAFWDDPWLMARIAAVHALNDVLAMGATPQAALAQITLPPIAAEMQEAWLNDILDGAGGAFAAEGVAIVGGHTSLGAELTIGFTVTGTGPASFSMGDAKAGDSLILTGPLGSGTILAGEMDGQAPGEAVAKVLDWMSSPRGHTARRLAAVANAMTDVTGFGLAGHLGRMALASGLSAEILLDNLPIFDGAEALSAQGIRSSIWTENRAAVDATLPDTPRAALLFDPQTAGGFLAAVQDEKAEDLKAELAKAGIETWIIGRMIAKGSTTIRAR
jgi:selenide,water dikinase